MSTNTKNNIIAQDPILEIKEDGLFKIVHEGQDIEVMFYNDHKKKNNCSQWSFEKKEKQGEQIRLMIAGRKRLNCLIPVDPKSIKYENTLISDKDGIFYIRHNKRKLKVQFINQYAKQQKIASNQLVKYMLSKDYFDIRKLVIYRFGTKQVVNLVILKD